MSACTPMLLISRHPGRQEAEAMKPRLLDLFCGAGGAGIRARFWKYVDKHGDDECWPWIGSLRENGYGQINIGQYPFKSHRICYFISRGNLPDDMEVLHT